jgi:hypothetical protein
LFIMFSKSQLEQNNCSTLSWLSYAGRCNPAQRTRGQMEMGIELDFAS